MEQRNIVVYTDKAGTLCPFEKSEKCLVFRNFPVWNVVDDFSFSPCGGMAMKTVRATLEELLSRLGDCHIIAGKAMGGLPYRLFDRAGYAIFEISESKSFIFDQILMDIDGTNTSRSLSPSSFTGPEQTDTPGVYTLDLARLQKQYPELSSKQALGDFLTSTPFLELHLHCEHLPPWIKRAGYQVEDGGKDEKGVHAVVYARTCDESKGRHVP